MNAVIVPEWVWRESSIVDGAYPAEMLVANTVQLRASVKLEESTGGDR